jgi:hypothetical protein
MRIMQRPATAVAAIALGVVVFFAGISLVMLRDGGWPWETTISQSAGSGTTTVEILDEDGTAYRFAGSPADAQHWLDRKQDDLKNAHGIPAKIAVGTVLEPVGLALVLAGLARLLWRLVTVRRSRSTGTPAELPDPAH